LARRPQFSCELQLHHRRPGLHLHGRSGPGGRSDDAGVEPSEQKAGSRELPEAEPDRRDNISPDRSARAHRSATTSRQHQESELPRNATAPSGTAPRRRLRRHGPVHAPHHGDGQPSVGPGGTESITTESLTIPADIPGPTPTHRLLLHLAYVDSERVVSELDEDNNLVQGGVLVNGALQPIKVTAPGYGFIACSRRATSASWATPARRTIRAAEERRRRRAGRVAVQQRQRRGRHDGLVFDLKFFP